MDSRIPTSLLLLALVAVVVAAALGALTKKGRRATGAVSGRRPLTEREQAMYFRLTRTLPEQVVLAQVAFSALLTTKDRPTRATFDRKVADFVVCDRAFTVLAAIELDDASHKGREKRDADRDALLTKAGIPVLRFKQVPDADALLVAFRKVTSDSGQVLSP
ncbi:MAG: DUF2726 domain-containing protein [Burkholderiales bacterium]|nr:DUF2726 domain-containing protein [Burkholderiales bacterium]